MIDTLRVVDLDSAPWHGPYGTVEKYGEPFDAFIDELDVDSGGTCVRCDAGIGSSTYDDFTDEGHRMGARWTWMTIVANEAGVVWTVCEDCSMAFAPKVTA